MLKLFLIAQAFHAASGQEVGGAAGSITPKDADIQALREPPQQDLAPKKPAPQRTLPKFLQWFLVVIQLSTAGTAIPAGILAAGTTATNKPLLWVASALCGSANISIFIVFLFSFFKGGKSNRFPLFITTVMGKLFTLWLSFILNGVGIVLGIAFLALNAGLTAGVLPLVHIITSFVVFILNLAYFCIYHMPSLGFFSIIWTPKLGFAATTEGYTLMALILAIVTQTAGHFGLSLGSKPFLDAVLLVVQIIVASSNLRNWLVNILKWFLAQRQKQEDAKINGPGGIDNLPDGQEGGPTSNPLNVVVGAER